MFPFSVQMLLLALLSAPLLTPVLLALSLLTLAFGVLFAVGVANDVAWRGSELVVVEASFGPFACACCGDRRHLLTVLELPFDFRRPCVCCSFFVDDGLRAQTLQGKATFSRALLRPRPLLSWSSVC